MNANHDHPSTVQALKERYPYMFAGTNIGFALYRGWFEMFARLCADIDAALCENKRNFHWVQIKEKFGSYRLYYSMERDPDDVSISYEVVPGPGHVGLRPKAKPARANAPASPAQVIRELVNRAEDATTSMCMACGQPAKAHSYNGYYLTLCKEHSPNRRLSLSNPVWKKVWQATKMPDDQEGSS
ncbi:hypothetical protein [Rhodoferax sediminis]|uniref:Uncharacterized protein n=1 Tax=Rhodoferax sediminis TaxID=2509614 RepID=A0A515D7U0_9BURK|nr:hypothetical protein [Rhodoferax sediminis]QDL36466.1 hypothetical protein EUB48_03515 [Rhodoferax sediminis]